MPIEQLTVPSERTKKIRFVVLVIFIALVFLTGGSSRADVLSLLVLRPLAVIVAIYALSVAVVQGAFKPSAPFLLLGALALLLMIQLVPLPPSLWEALPGRAVVVQSDELMGLSGVWRPITFSPSYTWNALFSLAIPAAALLLYEIQGTEYRSRIWLVFFAMALLSILLSLAQLLGGASSLAYLYRLTSEGEMVGIFANRNHNGIFLGLSIAIAAFILSGKIKLTGSAPRWAMFMVAAAVLFLFTMVIGSRAGLLVAAISLAFSTFVMIRLTPASHGSRSQTVGVVRRGWSFVKIIVPIALFGLLVVITIFAGRDEALSRWQGEQFDDDARFMLIPIYFDMAKEYFPVGIGFGAFELVFRQFEPDAFLHPQYLNEAHNEWIQIIIEGGLASGLIFAMFLAWFGVVAVRAVYGLTRNPRRGDRAWLAVFTIVIFGLASFVDYPLRVPSLMLVFALACAEANVASKHMRSVKAA